MNDIDILTQAVLRVSLHADAMESAVDELQDAVHRLQEEDVIIQQREKRLQQLLVEAQRIHTMNDMIVYSQNERAKHTALWSKELSFQQRHSTQCLHDSNPPSFVIPNAQRVAKQNASLHAKRTASLLSDSAPTDSKTSVRVPSCASSPQSTVYASSSISLENMPSSSPLSGLPLWRQALTEDEWEKIKTQKKRTVRCGDRSKASQKDCSRSRGARFPFTSSSPTSKRMAGTIEQKTLAKKPSTTIFATHRSPPVPCAAENSNDANSRTRNKSTTHAAARSESTSSTPEGRDAIETRMDTVDQQVVMAQRELAFLDRTSLRSRMRALQAAKAKVLATPITDILRGVNAKRSDEHLDDDTEDEEEERMEGDTNGEKVMFEEGVEALWSCDPLLSSLPSSSSFLPFVENLLASGTQKLVKRYEDAMHLLATNVKHKESPQETRRSSDTFAFTTSATEAPAREVSMDDALCNGKERGSSSTMRVHLTKDESSRQADEDKKILPGSDESSHRSGSAHGIVKKEEPSLCESPDSPHPHHLLSNFLKDKKVKEPNASSFSVVKRPAPPSSPSFSPQQEEEEVVKKLAYLRSCYAYATLLSHEDNKDGIMVEELQRQECEHLDENCSSHPHTKTIYSLNDVLSYNGWVPIAGEAVQKNDSVRSAPTNTTTEEECFTSAAPAYEPHSCASAKEHLFQRQKKEEMQEEQEMEEMFTSIFSGEDYACLPSSWPWMQDLCDTLPSYLLPPFHTVRVPRLTFNDVNEHLALIKMRMDFQRRIAKRVIDGLKLIDIQKGTLLALNGNRTSQHSLQANNKLSIKDITIAEARLFFAKHRGCRDPYAWTTLVEDDD